jgi:phosphatidylserine decarboxylase
VAKAGRVPVLAVAVLVLFAWWLLPAGWNLWVAGPLLTVLVLLANFFRDPERQLPARDGVFAVSPADGRVVLVDRNERELSLSIFLSVFDVHVNRAPVSGTIISITRVEGKYLPAYETEASIRNERVTLAIESPDAGRVRCTQVAGLLARRIDNWVSEGDGLKMGQRYGMIRFGSRVDLSLPPNFVPLVQVGQHVKGSLTVLAEVPRG